MRFTVYFWYVANIFSQLVLCLLIHFMSPFCFLFLKGGHIQILILFSYTNESFLSIFFIFYV